MAGDLFPSYPEFRELRLEDKSRLDDAFKRYDPQISEYTFTNLFVWRETFHVLLSHLENAILVKRWNPASNQFFLLPPIGTNSVVSLVKEMLLMTGERDFPPLYGVDRLQAESLKSEDFNIREMRDNWDYLYAVQDLSDLPGSKYYAKRKNIKNCLATYNPTYKPITEEIVNQCLQLQTKWCDLRSCDTIPGLEAEHRAIKETFLHFSDWTVFGGAVLVDGAVEAFTLGEWLNKDAAVIHFEKANPNIPGLYQVINQWFCTQTLQDFQYVNREQDLGVPGLRRAKLSYHPTTFIEKYVATL
jgi:hypothetical protein